MALLIILRQEEGKNCQKVEVNCGTDRPDGTG
jgi:hypothetical protein